MTRLSHRLRDLLANLPIKRLREPPPTVAVVRLFGPIGQVGFARQGLTLARLAGALDVAFGLWQVKAVALAINSPGGSAVQSALLAQRIRDLAEEKGVPVLAFAEDVAASGGYWLAAAADEIFVNESSIVGSIGVIAGGFGLAGLARRVGLRRRLYTAGERKSLLDPFLPEKPEEVARLQAVLDEVHGRFRDWVRLRRGERLKASQEDLFSGEFWTGARAIELGLADGVGELRQTLRQRFGKQVRLRLVNPEESWWRRRFGLPVAGPSFWAEEALEAAEARLLWTRYGL